jgi:uncharacterized protein YkwD
MNFFTLLTTCLLAFVLSACAVGFETAPELVDQNSSSSTGSEGGSGGPRDPGAINVMNRAQVIDAYRTTFQSAQVDMGFTGNIQNCQAGTTSLAYQNQVIERINYYRRMVGLSSVSLTPNVGSYQSAALMMAANGALSHSPPSSWRCYSSDGASGAGSSNLAIGTEGRGAIDIYMDDFGEANYAVGHRRWLLNPTTSTFATGDVPGANSLAVWMGSGNSAPAGKEFLMWPNEGYFPRSLLPFSQRWSLSALGWADLSQATVTARVVESGQNLSVRIEPYYSGFGLNTLVYVISPPPRGSGDTTVEVRVANIRLGAGRRDYVYRTILINEL